MVALSMYLTGSQGSSLQRSYTLKNSYKFLIGTILLLSCASLLSILSVNWVTEVSGWQTHTFLVINKAENLLSKLKDAEVGQQGYLLTNDQRFLEPYITAVTLIADRIHPGDP